MEAETYLAVAMVMMMMMTLARDWMGLSQQRDWKGSRYLPRPTRRSNRKDVNE